jgi:surface antigen
MTGLDSLRGKGDIIALDNDPMTDSEVPLRKTKNVSKTAEHLAGLVKLTSAKTKNYLSVSLHGLSSLKSFLVGKREYLPHVGIAVFALIAGSSNLVSASSVDNYATLAKVDPATTAGIIKDVIDPYTPIVKGSDIYESKSTLVMADGYIDKPQVVDTQITDRGASTNTTLAVVEDRTKNINYVVADGDTLSSIGWRYGIKLATLKYVNDMTNIDSIKPGQTLKIPPAGYEVSAVKIAQKDRQLALATRTTTARNSTSTRSSSSIKVDSRPGLVNNGYPYGWCTYYVATRRQVPTSMGNAGHWLSSAKSDGMPTGSTPVAGAIMVSSDSWAGHVAYVESVNGDGTFTVSEMNYVGWGKISTRTVSDSAGDIKGFIY